MSDRRMSLMDRNISSIKNGMLCFVKGTNAIACQQIVFLLARSDFWILNVKRGEIKMSLEAF